jgi:hypothetical protein
MERHEGHVVEGVRAAWSDDLLLAMLAHPSLPTRVALLRALALFLRTPGQAFLARPNGYGLNPYTPGRPKQ